MNLTTIGVHTFYAFLLIFARASGMIAVSPLLGNRSIPNTLKAGLALMLSLASTPLVEPLAKAVPADILTLILQVGGEAVLGIVIGYVARAFFSAVEIAGFLVDTQMGFGFLQLANPFAEHPASVLGTFQYQLSIVLYLLMNGHLLLMGSLVDSFRVVAPGGFLPQGGFGMVFLPLLQALLLLCLRIALPALGVLLILEIAFGLMARMVPTLNVFFIGSPAKVIIGLTTIGILLPAFAIIVGQVMLEGSNGIARLLPLAH